MYWDQGGPQAFPDIIEFIRQVPRAIGEFYATRVEIARLSGDFSKVTDPFVPGPRPEPAIDQLQPAREDFTKLEEDVMNFIRDMRSTTHANNAAISRLEAIQAELAQAIESTKQANYTGRRRLEDTGVTLIVSLQKLRDTLFDDSEEEVDEKDADEEEGDDDNDGENADEEEVDEEDVNEEEVDGKGAGKEEVDEEYVDEEEVDGEDANEDLLNPNTVQTLDSVNKGKKRAGSPLQVPTSKRLHGKEMDGGVETPGIQTAEPEEDTTTAKEKMKATVTNLLSNFVDDARAAQQIPAAELERGEILHRQFIDEYVENEALEFLRNYRHIPSTLRQLAKRLDQEQRDATVDEIQSLDKFPRSQTLKMRTTDDLLCAAEELEAELFYHQTKSWTLEPTVDSDRIPLDKSTYDELEQIENQANAARDLFEYDKAVLILSGPKVRFVLEQSKDEEVARVSALVFRENRRIDHTMNL